MTTNESRELLAMRVSSGLTIAFAVTAGVLAIFSDARYPFIRRAVSAEMVKADPRIDVQVLFSGA